MSILTDQIAIGPATHSYESARSLIRSPVAIAAITFLGVVTLVCISAPVTAPYDPLHQDLERVLSSPTAHNLLGTDTLGRDVLSTLFYGGQRSPLSGRVGIVAVLAIPVPQGVAAGPPAGPTHPRL